MILRAFVTLTATCRHPRPECRRHAPLLPSCKTATKLPTQSASFSPPHAASLKKYIGPTTNTTMERVSLARRNIYTAQSDSGTPHRTHPRPNQSKYGERLLISLPRTCLGSPTSQSSAGEMDAPTAVPFPCALQTTSADTFNIPVSKSAYHHILKPCDRVPHEDCDKMDAVNTTVPPVRLLRDLEHSTSRSVPSHVGKLTDLGDYEFHPRIRLHLLLGPACLDLQQFRNLLPHRLCTRGVRQRVQYYDVCPTDQVSNASNLVCKHLVRIFTAFNMHRQQLPLPKIGRMPTVLITSSH